MTKLPHYCEDFTDISYITALLHVSNDISNIDQFVLIGISHRKKMIGTQPY